MPVDVYIPGCPPRPEQILRALMDLQSKIQKGGTLAGNNGLPELREKEKMLAEKHFCPPASPWPRSGATRPDSATASRAGPGCSARMRRSKTARDDRTTGIRTVTDAATAETDVHAATLATLGRVLGEGAFTTSRFRDNLRLHTGPDRLVALITAIRDECGFALLTEIGGVDYLGYPGRDPKLPRFEVHYAMLNLDTNERLIVKVGVDDPEPTIPSLVPMWMGADWMEREVYDMYGIRFSGHPDLRRILMPEEFAAYPLRKDYPSGTGERHNFPGHPERA